MEPSKYCTPIIRVSQPASPFCSDLNFIISSLRIFSLDCTVAIINISPLQSSECWPQALSNYAYFRNDRYLMKSLQFWRPLWWMQANVEAELSSKSGQALGSYQITCTSIWYMQSHATSYRCIYVHLVRLVLYVLYVLSLMTIRTVHTIIATCVLVQVLGQPYVFVLFPQQLPSHLAARDSCGYWSSPRRRSVWGHGRYTDYSGRLTSLRSWRKRQRSLLYPYPQSELGIIGI